MIKDVTNLLELKRLQLEEKKERQIFLDELKAQNESFKAVIQSLKELKEAVQAQEYPESKDIVRVKNLSEIKIPDEIEVKKPKWFNLKQFSLNELIDSIGSLFDRLLSREFKVDLDKYKSAKESIAVRISNGKSFLESLNTGIAAGMGSIDFSGLATENKQDLMVEKQDSMLEKQDLMVNKQDLTVEAINNIEIDTETLSKEVTQQEISDKLNKFSLNQYEGGVTKYLGQENKLGDYLIVKIVDNVFQYATIFNNPTIETYTQAWTDRVTLTYTNYSGAFDD